jgi:hypothetical protein
MRPSLVIFVSFFVLLSMGCGTEPNAIDTSTENASTDAASSDRADVEGSSVRQGDVAADDAGPEASDAEGQASSDGGQGAEDDVADSKSSDEDTGVAPAPECTVETATVDCDDGNPCNGVETCGGDPMACMPGEPVLCDDGQACNGLESCDEANGECVPGDALECDDGEACNGVETCDDVLGECVDGTPMDCADDNVCTTDLCVAAECKYVVAGSVEGCGFSIQVQYPPRGGTVEGNPAVSVSGEIISPAGEVTELFLNGTELALGDNNTFTTIVDATIGVNLLEITAKNAMGQSEWLAQSFLYGDAFHLPSTHEAITMLDGVAGLWLDKYTFDDNQDDLDDFAAFVEFGIEALDLATMLPPSIEVLVPIPIIGDCTYDVDILSLDYSLDEVTLEPQVGKIRFQAVLKDLALGVQAETSCSGIPDVDPGTMNIDTIIVDAILFVTVSDGVPVVAMDTFILDISELEPDFDSVLLDTVLEFFAADIELLIEEALSTAVSDAVAPLMEGILTDFSAVGGEVELAPAPDEGGEATMMNLNASLSGVRFLPSGADFTLSLGAATEKKITLESPGSLAQISCEPGTMPDAGTAVASDSSCADNCGGVATSGCGCQPTCLDDNSCCVDYLPICVGTVGGGAQYLEHESAMEGYLHIDLVNQVLFNVWWAGMASMDLSGVEMDAEAAASGVSELEGNVQLLLPPVLTSCTDDGGVELHLGEVEVIADFQMFGQQASVKAYVSAWLSVDIGIATTDEGLGAVAVESFEVKALVMDVTEVAGIDFLDAESLEDLFGTAVSDMLAGDLLSSLLESYPIPVFDLSESIDGVAEGTNITFSPTLMDNIDGFMILGGDIVLP